MDDALPKDNYVNLRAELDHFAVNPFKPKEKLSFDTLINIINYDEKNEAVLIENDDEGNENKITVVKKYGYFILYENDEKKASFNDEVIINGEEYPAHKLLIEDGKTRKKSEVMEEINFDSENENTLFKDPGNIIF